MQEDARAGKGTVVGSQTVILQINQLEKLKGARGRPKNSWQQSGKKGESGRPQLATGGERSARQNRIKRCRRRSIANWVKGLIQLSAANSRSFNFFYYCF